MNLWQEGGQNNTRCSTFVGEGGATPVKETVSVSRQGAGASVDPTVAFDEGQNKITQACGQKKSAGLQRLPACIVFHVHALYIGTCMRYEDRCTWLGYKCFLRSPQQK